ncbi:MAG: hypothetical protein NT069_21975, partial [Planctomycetota bacterium]|nr:hypothetical protein [Planctomycetota bacterium]
MAKQVRKNSATGSNGVGGSNPSKTGNRAPGNAPAPGIPRHAGRKPVGTQFSRHALAALFPAECKDQAEMAKVMREDYQVALAETVIRANISAIPVRITT